MYIVFEGIVGTGKTTQSKLFVEYLSEKFPNKEVVWTREPGGSEIADEIRRVVQATPFKEPMEPICEAYLYAASRAQTLRSVVKPEIEKGNIVVSDRNFLTSLSFQAFGRGLGLDKVWNINKIAVEEMIPDMIIFLDLNVETAISRTQDADGDKFEKLGRNFFEKARGGYLKAGKSNMLKNSFVVIDASSSIEEIQKQVIDEFEKKLAVQSRP